MGFFLIALPVIAVLLFMLFKNSIIQHTISLLTSSLLIIIAVYLTTDVMVLGSAHHTALGGIFYIDALSIIVLDIVILIGFMASIYSVSYMETEIKHGKIDRGRLRLYYIFASFIHRGIGE